MTMSKRDAAEVQVLVQYLLGRDGGGGRRISPERAALALQTAASASYGALGGGVRPDEVLVNLGPVGGVPVPWVPMPDGCPGQSCTSWRTEHRHVTADLDLDRG